MAEQHLMQKIIIRQSNPDFKTYQMMAHEANNIYNLATYYSRKRLFDEGKYTSYTDLNKIFKQMQETKQSVLYTKLGIHIAQQMFKNVEQNFKAYFEARNAYQTNSKNFTSKPKLPKYHKKGAEATFTIDNQTFKFDKENQIINWKKANKLSAKWIKTGLQPIKLDRHFTIDKVQEIRVKPGKYYYTLLIIYKKNFPELLKDNGRYLAIDPGIDNFMTIVSNQNYRPIIINGKPLKSINQYANKLIAKTQSELMLKNNKQTSRKLDRIYSKRHFKIEQFMNESSKWIVDYASRRSISKIIVGKGTQSKRGAKLGKVTNQNFSQIPYARFFEMLTYKAQLKGIEVIQVDENYTSQTSFLDNELPIAENGNKARAKSGLKNAKRRVKRGLFVSDKGILINSDVNGALQIMKKVTPNFINDGVEDVVLRPIKL